MTSKTRGAGRTSARRAFRIPRDRRIVSRALLPTIITLTSPPRHQAGEVAALLGHNPHDPAERRSEHTVSCQHGGGDHPRPGHAKRFLTIGDQPQAIRGRDSSPRDRELSSSSVATSVVGPTSLLGARAARTVCPMARVGGRPRPGKPPTRVQTPRGPGRAGSSRPSQPAGSDHRALSVTRN